MLLNVMRVLRASRVRSERPQSTATSLSPGRRDGSYASSGYTYVSKGTVLNSLQYRSHGDAGGTIASYRAGIMSPTGELTFSLVRMDACGLSLGVARVVKMSPRERQSLLFLVGPQHIRAHQPRGLVCGIRLGCE
jgi:hypothetical protein